MSTLRVLLVEHDPSESERISSVLVDANHSVISAHSLEEASEALHIQKFDAVLLGSLSASGNLADFTAQLRNLEKQQRSGSRTPILSLDQSVPSPAPNCEIDGYLPQGFQPAAFADMIANLAHTVASSQTGAADSSDLLVFNEEEFRAQVAFDDDLMVEIIDLFLTERTGQMAEMHATFQACDYARLSRVAHTIKGSFGTLHAIRAKSHAQELEFAAKREDASGCRAALAALESDLAVLEPLLLALRGSSSSR